MPVDPPKAKDSSYKDRNHKVVDRNHPEKPYAKSKKPPEGKDRSRLKIVDITAGTKLKHPDVPFPMVLPQHEFSMLIIAEKGSGKTNLICNLIMHQFKGYFHNILICSPTVDCDEKWDIVKECKDILVENKELNKIKPKAEDQPVLKHANQDKEKFSGKIPEDNYFTKLEEIPERLKPQIDMLAELKKDYKAEAKFIADRVLLVIDDQAGHFKMSSTSNPLANFVMRHRHAGASVIVVTQAFKAMTSAIRTNCNCQIIFETFNDAERHKIYEENTGGRTWEEWMEMYTYATDKPFGFMYINSKFPKNRRVFSNFDEVLQ